MALFPPRADSSEASVTQVSMNGQNVQFDAGRSNRYLPGWKIYRCITTPAEGVEISFAVPSGEAIEVYASTLPTPCHPKENSCRAPVL